VYEVTDVGRRETRSWLRELVATPRHEYPAFVAALSLLVVLGPDEVTDLLYTRLRRLEEEVKDIETTRDEVVQSGVHPVFLVEDDYRVALLRAEVSFIHELLDRISDPGWVSDWATYHADDEPPVEGQT